MTLGHDAAYTALMNTATSHYFMFEVMARLDLLRCADQTAGKAVYNLIKTKNDLIDGYFFKLSDDQRFYLLHEGVMYEDWHKNREPNSWACSDGKEWPPNTFVRPETWETKRKYFLRTYILERTS